RVGPRVVGTLDGFRETAALGFAQPRPAVAAHVVERVPLPRLVAQQDEALAGDLDDHVVPGGGQRVVAADADPAAAEDALLLLGEHFGGRVIAPGQGARALTVAVGSA